MLTRTARLILLAALVATGCSVFADPPQVATSLIADRDRIVPGDTFRIGVLFRIPARGHIYWLNPGESGLPTEIEWTPPEGLSIGPLQWPIPTAFRDEVLNETTFGYEREVLLIAQARAPDTLSAGESILIGAEARWLVCLEDSSCFPESAALHTRIAIAEQSAPSASSPVFDAFAARVPGPLAAFADALRVEFAAANPAALRIHLVGPWRASNALRAFFPDEGGPWAAGTVDPRNPQIITFVSPKPIDNPPAGALHLDLTATGGQSRSVYVRVDR